MTRLKWILAVTSVTLLTIFVFQNTATVEVAFLLWRFEMSRVLMLVLAGLTGFLVGLVAARWIPGRPPRET